MSKVPLLTAGVAWALGLAFAFLIPPFQLPDEHAHFARAYQISVGRFLPQHESRLPDSVLSCLEQFPEIFAKSAWRNIHCAPVVPASDLPASSVEKLEHFNWGLLATQMYSPIVYLPASMGIRIGRAFGTSAVGMLYVARCLNVLVFVIALAAVLLLLPNYGALVTAIALMPMTLAQAGAISADCMTIALSLIGFALVLRTREIAVRRSYLLLLLLFVPLWVLCKNSWWALPLLLLIPAAQFGGRSKRAAYLITATVLSITLLITWRHLSDRALADFRMAGLAKGIDLDFNTRQIASHPLGVLHDVLAMPYRDDPPIVNNVSKSASSNTIAPVVTFVVHMERLMKGFVAGIGWTFIKTPVRPLYLLLLFVIAFIERSPKPFSAMERVVLGVVFTGALVGTYLVLFAIDGKTENGHWSFWSVGVQGRYLIPYCLAGFLLLKQDAIHTSSRVLAPLVLGACALYGVVSLGVLARAYY